MSQKKSIGELYTDQLEFDAERKALYEKIKDFKTRDNGDFLFMLSHGSEKEIAEAAEAVASGPYKQVFEKSVERFEKQNNSRRQFLKKSAQYLMWGGLIGNLTGAGISMSAERKMGALDDKGNTASEAAHLKQESHTGMIIHRTGLASQLTGVGFSLVLRDKTKLAAPALSSKEQKERDAIAEVVGCLACGLATNLREAARLNLPSPRGLGVNYQIR